jgi:hypothetical protein
MDENFIRVKQKVPAPKIVEPREVLEKKFKRVFFPDIKGKRIAICVPSRKIKYLKEIVKIAGEELAKRGGHPFIAPAMGSHAGGTAQSQIEHLRRMGITEEETGLEILSTDEVLEVFNGRKRFFFEKNVYESDYIFLINRIRPHTAFEADFGSGLMKLSAVGLGKTEGAWLAHRYGLKKYIPLAFNHLLKKGKILGGIGIVESFKGEPVVIEVLSAKNLVKEEKRLFSISKKLLLKLPFYPVDIFVVREMGKDISGTGLDTNVIGMERRKGQGKRIKCVVVLNITPDSFGNLYGLGFADIITEKIIVNADWSVTYRNAFSTGCLQAVKIPLVAPDEESAISFAYSLLNKKNPTVVIAESTGRLEYLLLNQEALKRAKRRVKVVQEGVCLSFDAHKNLLTPIYP